jgi:hypothetical protein
MAAAHPTCRRYLVLFEASNAAGSMAETVQAHCLDQPRLSAERINPPTARQGYGRHLTLSGHDRGRPTLFATRRPRTAARAKVLGLDPAAFLTDNNSICFFAKLRDLLVPGPTYTNVNDSRAIVVDRP